MEGKPRYKLYNYINKNRWIVVLIIIFIIGALLRIINFGDLLVFKSDQARDALIMNKAQDGSLLDLSLLGPQVGGTGFRLGAITYYFQYISGKIFGFTPESFAYPDLIFGILTIPLFFLLFRRFFTVTLSLWITSLASFSLLLVTFSRFGWNPNSLPFFTALFANTFLYALESKGRRHWWYLSIAAACVGVIAQLHLAAILGLGLGLTIFLILSRSSKWKEIILCVMIVGFFHFPVFINEWQTHGGNTQELIRAVNKKGSKDSGHAIYEKIFRAYQEGAQMTWLVATGRQNTDMILTRGYSIKCDNKCESALPYSIAVMLIFGYMIVAGYFTWKNEKDLNKKRAIAFLELWMGGFLLVTVLLAYQLEMRFYLGIIPPLLILLGFAIERVMNIYKNVWIKRLMVSAGIVVIIINLYSTATYLRELAVSQVSAEESSMDLRFGTAPKVTLGQLRKIASEANNRFSNSAPTIVTGESLYAKSMYYVLSAENGRKGCYMRGDNEVAPWFNNLIIEYAPSEKAQTQFGTLAAGFISASSVKSDAPLPEGCLTY